MKPQLCILFNLLVPTILWADYPIVSPAYNVTDTHEVAAPDSQNREVSNMVRVGNSLYITYRRDDNHCYIREFDLATSTFVATPQQVSDLPNVSNVSESTGYHYAPSVLRTADGTLVAITPLYCQRCLSSGYTCNENTACNQHGSLYYTIPPRYRTIPDLYTPATWSVPDGFPSRVLNNMNASLTDVSGVYDPLSGVTHLVGEGTVFNSNEPGEGSHRVYYRINSTGQFEGPYMLVKAASQQPPSAPVCSYARNVFVKGDLVLGQETTSPKSLHLIWTIRNTFRSDCADARLAKLVHWEYNVYYAKSLDGGLTWQNLNGEASVDLTTSPPQSIQWNDSNFLVYTGDVGQTTERGFDVDKNGYPAILLHRHRPGTGDWDEQLQQYAWPPHVNFNASPAPSYDLVCYRWDGSQWQTSVVDETSDFINARSYLRIDEDGKYWIFVQNLPGMTPYRSFWPARYKVSSDQGQTWSSGWTPVTPDNEDHYVNVLYSYKDPLEPNVHYLAWPEHGVNNFSDVNKLKLVKLQLTPKHIYVDDDASTPYDGTAEHPFKTIQGGIDAASDGDLVLVRAGTYTGTGNRNIDYGGRLITVKGEGGASATIIDCENTTNRGFYFHNSEGAGSILDGFTVKNAVCDWGAAIRINAGCNPTIKNCVLVDNVASTSGAGIFCLGSATLINCAVLDNSAQYGAGIRFDGSTLSIIGCTVAGNNATEAENRGAGLFSGSQGTVTIRNSIFWNDGDPVPSELRSGTATFDVQYSDIRGQLYSGTGNISADPMFSSDYHLSVGSPCIDAGHNSDVPAGTTTDVEGEDRIVNGDGDTEATVDMGSYEFQPIYVDDDASTPYDGTAEHPFKTIQGGIDAAVNGDLVLVRAGTYTGTGNRNIDYGGRLITVKGEGGASATIIDCEHTANRGFYFHNSEGTTSILDGFTVKNAECDWGAAIRINAGCNPTIKNCVLVDNVASTSGAGICCLGNATLINCAVLDNSAQYGAGIRFDGFTLSITSCTLAGNIATDADNRGAGLFRGSNGTNTEGTVTIRNSIFWDDGDPAPSELRGGTTPFDVQYSDIRGGYSGTGNFSDDPMFTSGYHLSVASPCIDAGHNSDVPAGTSADVEGEDRIVNGDGDTEATVDMGSYEFQPM